MFLVRLIYDSRNLHQVRPSGPHPNHHPYDRPDDPLLHLPQERVLPRGWRGGVPGVYGGGVLKLFEKYMNILKIAGFVLMVVSLLIIVTYHLRGGTNQKILWLMAPGIVGMILASTQTDPPSEYAFYRVIDNHIEVSYGVLHNGDMVWEYFAPLTNQPSDHLGSPGGSSDEHLGG